MANQGHRADQPRFQLSPCSAPQLVHGGGSPHCLDTAVWTQASFLALALARGPPSTKGLVAIFTPCSDMQLKAVLARALQSYAAQPRSPGGPVARWVVAAGWAAPGLRRGGLPGRGLELQPLERAVSSHPGTSPDGEKPAFSVCRSLGEPRAGTRKVWSRNCLRGPLSSRTFSQGLLEANSCHRQASAPRKSAPLGTFRAHAVARSQSPALERHRKAVTTPMCLQVPTWRSASRGKGPRGVWPTGNHITRDQYSLSTPPVRPSTCLLSTQSIVSGVFFPHHRDPLGSVPSSPFTSEEIRAH